jgi:hypothetical protein
MRKYLILGAIALLAAGCGGSGGGDDGTGDPGATTFRTADVRGLSAALAPGAGAMAPPGGSADFGAVADSARTEIAPPSRKPISIASPATCSIC